jgi:hypothetical protein
MTKGTMKARASILAVLLSIPLSAHAAFEWATWGPTSGNTSHGVFSSGQRVLLTADFTDISGGVAAGVEYTVTPPVVGRSDNTNPPFQRYMSGPPPYPRVLDPGTPVALLDLSSIAGASNIVLGLADHKFQYRIEFRDAAGGVLSYAPSCTPTPCTPPEITSYNIVYIVPAGLSADYDLRLASGILYLVSQHDGGGYSNQTGLTTFSSLPPQTRYIALFTATGTQETEGLQIYLGADLAGSILVTDSKGTADDRNLPFGNVTIGVGTIGTVTVTNNTGSAAAIQITESLAAPFGIFDPQDCTLSLPASQSCTITITYDPIAAMASSDSFTLSLAGTPTVVTVSGTGSPATPVSAPSGGGGCSTSGNSIVSLLPLLGVLFLRRLRASVLPR